MKLTRECSTHGIWDGLVVSACPTCLTELRDENELFRRLLREAYQALRHSETIPLEEKIYIALGTAVRETDAP